MGSTSTMSFYRITGLTCEGEITDIGLFTRAVNTMLMEEVVVLGMFSSAALRRSRFSAS